METATSHANEAVTRRVYDLGTVAGRRTIYVPTIALGVGEREYSLVFDEVTAGDQNGYAELVVSVRIFGY